MKTNSVVAILLASLAVVGCSEDNPLQPPTWTGAVTLACGQWLPAKPGATRILVDVGMAPEDPLGPSDRQLDVLERHGGKIQYKFHIPLVRVDIPLDSLEVLEAKAEVNFAKGVSFPELYTVESVSLWYDRAIQSDDLYVLFNLGVQIQNQIDESTLLVDSPDESLPSLRLIKDLRIIELDYYFCGTIAGGTSPNLPLQPAPAEGVE